MRESKQVYTASEMYGLYGSGAYSMKDKCACCGESWGGHIGPRCPRGGTTFALCEEAPKRVESLGELLQRALDRSLPGAKPVYQRDPGKPIAAPDPNARMIARDGPAKPAAVVIPKPAEPTAKPAISGLQRVYSNTH